MTEQWTQEIAKRLAARFPEKDHQWVIVATRNKNKPDESDLWAPYLDADAIRQRLDDVCGAGGWSMDMQAASATSIICRLTILGVTRADVGDGKDADQPLKAAATDALKRAAVNFGIGRYLHKVPKQWRKPQVGPPRGNGQAAAGSPSGNAQAASPQPAPPPGNTQLTPGQQAFQDIMKAHDLTLPRACDALGLFSGDDPRQALRTHIHELMKRKNCDEGKAYKAAADELSAAAATATLSS